MNTNSVQIELSERHDMQAWRDMMRDRDTEVLCTVRGCDNEAHDIHHENGNHDDDSSENLAPICKPHHNAAHGIGHKMNDLTLLTRSFYTFQRDRMGMEQRVKAHEQLGLEPEYAKDAAEEMKQLESRLSRRIGKALDGIPIWDEWLEHIKGIGPLLAGSLISEVGSPDRFATVSKLWYYCGIAVRDGHMLKKRKGKKANWNHQLRTTCWKIGEQFVRSGGLGRELYDKYRAHYEERDDNRAHFKAKHRAAKDFIRCLWVRWRQTRDEPVTEPHPKTEVFPDDWIE